MSGFCIEAIKTALLTASLSTASMNASDITVSPTSSKRTNPATTWFGSKSTGKIKKICLKERGRYKYDANCTVANTAKVVKVAI